MRRVPVDDQREGNGPRAMISTAAALVFHKYTGRGPTRTKTLINDDVVTILLGDTLTKGERKLIDNGHSGLVIELRQAFQLLMRDELVEIVERQLERRVTAFMSQDHIDPDLAAEVFVLEPAQAVNGEAGNLSQRSSEHTNSASPGTPAARSS
jgi:uncharacterized protein YbcI